MSRISDLITAMCPDGVPFRRMGDIGTFYGGLSGKSKEDFKDGNAVFISYMNVYSNIELQTDVADRVRVSDSERQNTVQYGDVLFTGSSETPDECGMSSVLTTHTDQKLYLNSFCFGYRFNDPEMFLPGFTKHLFRSTELRAQITRTASGVTRFNVSKKRMEDVTIPVPPIEVQREIVQILDNFTELTAELTARQKQYKYYSEQLLDGFKKKSKLVPISDLGKWQGGKTPSMDERRFWENGTIPWISSKDMKAPVLRDTQDHITQAALTGASMTLFPADSVAIVTRSGILKHTFPVAYVPFQTTVNQDIKVLTVREGVSGRYVSLALQAYGEDILARTKKQGGTVDSLDFQKVLDYIIPLPEYDVQMRIVEVLDNFDAICSDLSIGLPAEIDARQKQYEFYRDQLLTFVATGDTILTDRQAGSD